MEQLNAQLFLWLNASSQPGQIQLWLATLVAEWLIYGLPLLLILLWIAGKRPSRRAAVTATLSVLLALACGQLIGLLWPHPRPFMIGLGQTLLAHQPETSFPSDHVTVFLTLGLSLLWSGWRKLATLVLLTGTLVAWSRVYLGIHFPLDMLGALLLAIPSALIMPRLLLCGQLGEKLLDRLERIYTACLIHGRACRH
jgi:undecaprenyl-diphosphatase